MASSCSECNNLFESKNKIKRWARTKRDAHTRKEGTGTCVRCFNKKRLNDTRKNDKTGNYKNRRREQRKNARKRVHSDIMTNVLIQYIRDWHIGEQNQYNHFAHILQLKFQLKQRHLN